MIFARNALLGAGWQQNVRLIIDGGRISDIFHGDAPQSGDHIVECLVPGMPNLHSHAFQRGFSGLTERRGAVRDSFWTWRDMMYRFALTLDPDGVQAIAEMAYVEMLEAGFTRVGEFHYLHHAPDGSSYANPAELSARVFAAATASGIALTHLPVFYAHGGFGPKEPDPGQRRFVHSLDTFVALLEACDGMVERDQDRVGFAPHSLRAVSEAELQRLATDLAGRRIHIHIAEQMAEVQECLAVTGARPVEWMLGHADVDANWCLIHATHLSEAETSAIADSGAVVGLCPVTEANLGDGLFPGGPYLERGGRIGIGTDSNVRIGVAEELRTLEYGQRLLHRERNVLAQPEASTGVGLFGAALAGGAQALAAEVPELEAGAPADLVALCDPHRLSQHPDTLIDRWIFGQDVSVSEVWAAGSHVVTGGRHIARDAVAARFGDALRQVLD